ncbi:hypothetical protein Xmau_04095 [Xenorhabdus mauleonii]|uniref:Uncharacterized protein n=1 Tax=Xenorhabdus mauleonii TaxID=351675 RepID=A0A2G0NPS4_9GAMM|nr:hypothetical protein Xmau_04095 [Xenorhabdus mauleonii]
MVIVAEAVMPVTAGGSGAEYPTAFVVGYRQVGLVSVMPTGHSPLLVVLMPQVVVLEGVTLTQIAVRVVLAGQQALLYGLVIADFLHIERVELPVLMIMQDQPQAVMAFDLNQSGVFIIDKINPVLAAVGDGGQFPCTA